MSDDEPVRSLEPPILLLAMPQVLDPFFHKSVILLIHHEEAGSLGFIVNRPTKIKVGEVLRGLEIEWRGQDNQLAHFGGPVQPQLGTVIYGFDGVASGTDKGAEILPGVAMTQHLTELQGLADAPPGALRLILGHAGWGDGQLLKEIRRNDWLTAPPRPDLIFADDPDAAWEHALASVGIDPATLPAWTLSEEDGDDDLLAN